MRCNWFPKASHTSLPYVRAFQKTFRPSLLTQNNRNHGLLTGIYRHIPTLAFHRFVSTLTQSPVSEPGSAGDLTLTPAQLSRAVWHSVRLAMQTQDLHTAYIIVESVRLSNKPLLHNSPSVHYRATGIEFFDPVSQRLSGHALVHGLLRLGLPRRAHAAAKILMDNGVAIHTKTLETLLEALVASDGSTPRSSGQEFLNYLKIILSKRNVLSLHPSLTGGKGNRAAFDLFTCARNQKQQRTERMYRTIFATCLLHGELIAATILFAVILKDCAVRDAIGRQLGSPEIKEDPQVEQQIVEHYRFLRRSSPYPSWSILKEIVTSIADVLLRDPVEDVAYQLPFKAALQALANLAYMLDIRQLPYPHLSSLIRLLYTCPKCDDLVWIVGKDNKPVQTKAYDYFHLVLQRFIQHPPRSRQQLDGSKPTKELLQWKPTLNNSRPLDLPACNSLIHYALRHRLSPNSANTILQYMQDPFWKESGFRRPVPNEATYNIILSSGRLLRSPVMAETALRMFQSLPNDVGLGTIHCDPEPVSPNLDSTKGLSSGRFSKSLRRLASESHELSISPPKSTFRAGSHTLTSYISYLVSTGRPHLIPDILFELLPELTIIDHPSWGNLQPEEVRRIRRTSRYECLRRVVAYGPHFFVAILNAIVKAGRTGLAERVWHLAKEAERASFLPAFNDGHIKPWCLPVHAYTLMIVCYDNESRKVYRRMEIPPTARNWQPISKRYVVGWAHYIQQRNANSGQPLLRSVAGRESAVSLYDSLLRGARSVYGELQKFQSFGETLNTDWNSLELPVPDERFFNAMLRIVTKHSTHRLRRARTIPSHWRQHIRFADWMYRKHGQLQNRNDTDLLVVAKDMVKAGFQVPIGLRYLLVGQDSSLLRHPERSRVVSFRNGPWAYPVDRLVQRPFALSVEKQKGLPLGRVPHRQRLYSRRLRKSSSSNSSNIPND